MSTGDGFERGRSRVPEQVHRHTEATLKQSIAAGDVARAMWRLLVAERSRHPMSEPEQLARRTIDTFRRQHETTLDVYVMAAYAAALATARACTGSRELRQQGSSGRQGQHTPEGRPVTRTEGR